MAQPEICNIIHWYNKDKGNWDTCNNFVTDPKQKLEESYWEIDWIKIFQKNS